jgi:hypothetical protein
VFQGKLAFVIAGRPGALVARLFEFSEGIFGAAGERVEAALFEPT